MREDTGEKKGFLCLKPIKVYGTSGSDPAATSASYAVPHRCLQGLVEQVYVEHIVQQTDTLQGISLKYNVSMEEIKRHNRLWGNDSVCVRQREYLKIPVRKSSGLMNDSLNSSNDSVDSSESEHQVKTYGLSTSTSLNSMEENPNDFFGRIDASVNKLREVVVSMPYTSVKSEPVSKKIDRGRPWFSSRGTNEMEETSLVSPTVSSCETSYQHM